MKGVDLILETVRKKCVYCQCGKNTEINFIKTPLLKQAIAEGKLTSCIRCKGTGVIYKAKEIENYGSK